MPRKPKVEKRKIKGRAGGGGLRPPMTLAVLKPAPLAKAAAGDLLPPGGLGAETDAEV